jgi:hypothetical protein
VQVYARNFTAKPDSIPRAPPTPGECTMHMQTLVGRRVPLPRRSAGSGLSGKEEQSPLPDMYAPHRKRSVWMQMWQMLQA